MTIWEKAFRGSLLADALAMPVHWYYDTAALRRDYGDLTHFQAPRNPHPNSILWRSHYRCLNARGDILGEQARYWGQREIHYHQFLKAGENTLNFKLARLLYEDVRESGSYDSDRWLERYIAYMLQPDNHRDTYIEEVHRGFFTLYARGKSPRECAIADEHIGGLAAVPALLAALAESPLEEKRAIVQTHVGLTHQHKGVLSAADTLVCLLGEMEKGEALCSAIRKTCQQWIPVRQIDDWVKGPDEAIIGPRYSPACYIRESMPAALFLAYKYHDRFREGLTANAMAGGDNCHRGAVVGSLLAAMAPSEALNPECFFCAN